MYLSPLAFQSAWLSTRLVSRDGISVPSHRVAYILPYSLSGFCHLRPRCSRLRGTIKDCIWLSRAATTLLSTPISLFGMAYPQFARTPSRRASMHSVHDTGFGHSTFDEPFYPTNEVRTALCPSDSGKLMRVCRYSRTNKTFTHTSRLQVLCTVSHVSIAPRRRFRTILA